MSFFSELKRRNVIRASLAYIFFAWLLLQIIDFALDAIGAPNWILQTMLILAAAGLPAVIVTAWVYELTPEGLKKDAEVNQADSIRPQTAKRLDTVVIVSIAILVVFLITDRFRAPTAEEPTPPAATAATSKSIAVLPFTTRSTSDEDRFFSDGMHDDLLTQLAKISELKVISRTSVMAYRDATTNLRQIGEELGVVNILEGAVQRSGQQVRINMQLIDARTDEHLWAETYDREITANNLFAIQSEIAHAVTQALHATLTPEQEQALAQTPTSNLSALEAYRHSRNISSIFDESSLLNAQREARRAVELDPDFAEAWAQLGYINMALYWHLRDEGNIELARAAIDQAQTLKPDSPETANAEAYYWYWGFLDYARSLSYSMPALEQFPNNPELLQVAAYVNRRQGNVEETLNLLRHAVEISPLDRELHYSIAETERGRWHFREAEIWTEKVLALDPTYFRSLGDKASLHAAMTDDPKGAAALYKIAYERLPSGELTLAYYDFLMEAGMFEEALALSRTEYDTRPLPPESSRTLEGMTLLAMAREDDARPLLDAPIPEYQALAKQGGQSEMMGVGSLCLSYGALGDADRTRESCTRMLNLIPADEWSGRFYRTNIMSGFAMAGLENEALELLEEMMERPFRPIPNRLRRMPSLANLHDHPRFESILSAAEEIYLE